MMKLTISYITAKIAKVIFLFFILLSGFYLNAQAPQESKLIVLSLAETCQVPFDVKLQVVLDALTLEESSYISWNFRDGSTYKQPIADINKVITHRYMKSGTFSVQATVVKNGGEIILATTIVIGAPDLPSITLDPILSCDGKVSLKESSVNNGIPSDKYRVVTWDFGDGQEITITRTNKETSTINHDFPNGEGTYNTKVTVQNQCGSGTASATVRVLAPPVENFDIVDPACMNQVKLLAPAPPSGIYYRYNWDFGDGQKENTTKLESYHSYDSPGNKNVKLHIEVINANASCIKDVEKTVAILESPVIDFKTEYTPACDSMLVHINNSSTGDVYSWNFGRSLNDTSSTKNPSDQKYFVGDYTIKLRSVLSSTGCSAQLSKSLRVNETPKVQFHALPVCEGQEAVFTDQSTIQYGMIDSIRWYFETGETSNISLVYLTFPQAGATKVRLKAFSSNCYSEMEQAYFVKAKPRISVFPRDTSLCPGMPILLKNIENLDSTDYQWKFGDGEVSFEKDSVSHLYKVNDKEEHQFKIHVRATANGCENTDSAHVKIKVVPTAAFNSNVPDYAVCGPALYNFQSTVSKPVGTSIEWFFSDSSQSIIDQISVSKTFENKSNFSREIKVLMKASLDGCSDTAYKIVKLHPVPETGFKIDTLSLCQPALFEFWTPPSLSNQYIWEINGQRKIYTQNRFVQSFTNTSRNDSAIPVKYIAINEFACSDSVDFSLTVPATTLANFEVIPATVFKYGETILANNLSENRNNWSYHWNYGETNDTLEGYKPLSYKYKTWGFYKIYLKIKDQNNCIDTLSKWVRMLPPEPKVAISISPVSGCIPLHVQFKDYSYGTDPSATVWEINGNTRIQKTNFEYDFLKAGKISVRYRTRDLLGNELPPIDTFLFAYKIPASNFTAVPKRPILPDEAVYCVLMIQDSTEKLQYFWDFGDNQTSAELKPKHVYTNEGPFKISLKVVSENGCESYSELEEGDYIRPLPGGELQVPNAFMPNMHGSSGGKILENDLSYTVFAPVSKGVIEYKLEIYDRWGERIFESNDKDFGWDGYYHGKLCKQDAYVWKVSGLYINQQSFYRIGTVTLFHSKK